MTSSNFEIFAIVELFGHAVIAGKVTEQRIGGQDFIRVDVPGIDGQDGFTKFFGTGAIYAITPTDEATTIEATKGLKPEPIDIYKINIHTLEAGNAGDEEW